MNKTYSFSELQEKISAAQKILIALPPRPMYDQIASALALFLSIQEAGKTVFVTCPTPMTVEFNHLVGVDKISEKVHGTDLIVSFDYPAEQVEKVSYNDDNGKPNLVVQIKANAPQLSQNSARFSYAGIGADLVIMIGVRDINQIASDNSFTLENVIDIDNDPTNLQYGQVNVIDAEASCLSEVVLGVISGLGLPLNADISQNLLFGIWTRTSALSNKKVSADTYESVAICLRMGAQRPETSVEQRFNQQPPRPRFESHDEGRVQPPRSPQPQMQQQVQIPQPQSPPVEEKPKEQPRQGKPPADWFEPKIFRGTSNA